MVFCQDDITFRAQADFIVVNVQVLSGASPVAGLSQKDFRVWDNGEEQKIEAFGTENQSIDLMLLLDFSESTTAIEVSIKRNAKMALSALHQGDRVGAVVFDTKPYLISPLSMNGNAVADAILGIPWIGGETELNNQVRSTAQYLRSKARPNTSRHIVLLTDNRGAEAVAAREVQNELWESDVVLNALLFDGPNSPRPPGYSADIRKFVEATGGELLKEAKGNQLTDLVERLHKRYVLLYRGPEGTTGDIHQIRVDLAPGVKQMHHVTALRARTGYRLGEPGSTDRIKLEDRH